MTPEEILDLNRRERRLRLDMLNTWGIALMDSDEIGPQRDGVYDPRDLAIWRDKIRRWDVDVTREITEYGPDAQRAAVDTPVLVETDVTTAIAAISSRIGVVQAALASWQEPA